MDLARPYAQHLNYAYDTNSTAGQIAAAQTETYVYSDISGIQVPLSYYVPATPVRDQGSCGSCWVFAALHALQSAFLRDTKQTVPLAPNSAASCVHYLGSWGCAGGWGEHAIKDFWSTFGAPIEDEVPYLLPEKSRLSSRLGHVRDVPIPPYVVLQNNGTTTVAADNGQNPLFTGYTREACDPRWQLKSRAIIDSYYAFVSKGSAADITNIKALLVKHGSEILTTMYMGDIMMRHSTGIFRATRDNWRSALTQSNVKQRTSLPFPLTSEEIEGLPAFENHQMTIVGFSTREVDAEIVQYWTLKNTWGPNWGCTWKDPEDCARALTLDFCVESGFCAQRGCRAEQADACRAAHQAQTDFGYIHVQMGFDVASIETGSLVIVTKTRDLSVAESLPPRHGALLIVLVALVLISTTLKMCM